MYQHRKMYRTFFYLESCELFLNTVLFELECALQMSKTTLGTELNSCTSASLGRAWLLQSRHGEDGTIIMKEVRCIHTNFP